MARPSHAARVAAPWSPAPPWPSPGPEAPRNVAGIVLLVAFMAVWFVIAIGILTSALSFGAPSFFVVAVCGMILFGVVFLLVALLSGTARRRALPPPPPIQQPMVPASAAGPVELMCPNCGAAPRSVDRFGIATCDYCDTRFLVR